MDAPHALAASVARTPAFAPLARPDAAALAAAAAPFARIECALGDFTSVARGKWSSRADFLGHGGCRLPSVLLGLTLTAGEPEAVFGPLLPASYLDMDLVPDLSTLVPASGGAGSGAGASVICEPVGLVAAPGLGRSVCVSEYSPRAALRGVLARLEAAGLQATVAPELELFLLDRRQVDGRTVLGAPGAQPGAPARERACEAYSLERAGLFDAYFDALFQACEAQRVPVSGHAHEASLSQYEVNFRPGEPVAQADAVFRFKRLARATAARFGFLASFAPKPFLDQPGTGLHWHFSLQHRGGARAGEPQGHTNAFAAPDGRDRPALAAFLGGLQAHTDAAMAFFAPHDMAFERIALSNASPERASWGHDDRAVAYRLPAASPQNRRIENRLPGGDANPYLTVAATLGLGLDGLLRGLAPAGESAGVDLPRSLPDALAALGRNTTMRQLLGDPLVELFIALKAHEHAERAALADPRQDWDFAHLIELA